MLKQTTDAENAIAIFGGDKKPNLIEVINANQKGNGQEGQKFEFCSVKWLLRRPRPQQLQAMILALEYDPETGKIWRKDDPEQNDITYVLNQDSTRLYKYLNIFDHVVAAHNAAWFLQTGEFPKSWLVVDHINNDSWDNRFANLRLISKRLNSSKDKPKRFGPHGEELATGVSVKQVRPKTNAQAGLKPEWVYEAKIHVKGSAPGAKGKVINLGNYKTAAEAKAAYEFASQDIDGTANKPKSSHGRAAAIRAILKDPQAWIAEVKMLVMLDFVDKHIGRKAH